MFWSSWISDDVWGFTCNCPIGILNLCMHFFSYHWLYYLYFYVTFFCHFKNINFFFARELEEKLRFLCQFLTSQEFDSFVNSWLRQISLRRRASELARYRQAGLTRYEEIPHYEQESIYRSDTKPSLLLAPNTSPVCFSTLYLSTFLFYI